jgi:hypothetical protein
MKIKPDEEVLKMRKLALAEDTNRECDLILRMRKSANKLIKNRENIEDLEERISEFWKYFGDVHGCFKDIDQLEKALEKSNAKSVVLEAEYRLVKQEYADFPSLLSIMFEEEPSHPLQGIYKRIQDIVYSEEAMSGPVTNEKLCSCLQAMVLGLIKAESEREREGKTSLPIEIR